MLAKGPRSRKHIFGSLPSCDVSDLAWRITRGWGKIRPVNSYTCNRGCGYSSRTAQGIRAHSRFCPNRFGQAVPTGTRTGITLGTRPRLIPALVPPGEGPVVSQIQAERERLELRRLQEANRELDAKAQRRDEAKWEAFLRESDRRERERAERAADQRRSAEATEVKAQEEHRQREAHKDRVQTGKRLAEKALETVPGVGPWARFKIQQGVAEALEKAPDTEPLQKLVDNALSIQLRLHAPPKPTEPAHASVPPINPPAPADADASDDEPDDEEDDEVCDDPNCAECAAADAGGSGWGGLVLALGGIAVLAAAKHLADKRPAAPPVPPATA